MEAVAQGRLRVRIPSGSADLSPQDKVHFIHTGYRYTCIWTGEIAPGPRTKADALVCYVVHHVGSTSHLQRVPVVVKEARTGAVGRRDAQAGSMHSAPPCGYLWFSVYGSVSSSNRSSSPSRVHAGVS